MSDAGPQLRVTQGRSMVGAGAGGRWEHVGSPDLCIRVPERRRA